MKLTHWVLGAAMLLATTPAFAQQEGAQGGGLSAPQKSSFRDTLRSKGGQEVGPGTTDELERVRFEDIEALKQQVQDLEQRIDVLESQINQMRSQEKGTITPPRSPEQEETQPQPAPEEEEPKN